MLKKLLITLVAVLTVEVTVGSLLVSHFDPTVKMVHGIVGALIGVMSIGVAYSAFRDKAPMHIKALTVVISVITALAYIGGKLTATNYELGLMLMRVSGVTALLLSATTLYIVWNHKKK